MVSAASHPICQEPRLTPNTGRQTVLETQEAGGIAAGPRRARDIAVADRIWDDYEHNGNRARGLQDRRHPNTPRGQDDVGCKGRKFPPHSVGQDPLSLRPSGNQHATFQPSIQSRACSPSLQSLGEVVQSTPDLQQPDSSRPRYGAHVRPAMRALIGHAIALERGGTSGGGEGEPVGAGTPRADVGGGRYDGGEVDPAW